MQHDCALLRAQIDLVRKDPSLLTSQGEFTHNFHIPYCDVDVTCNRAPVASNFGCYAFNQYVPLWTSVDHGTGIGLWYDWYIHSINHALLPLDKKFRRCFVSIHRTWQIEIHFRLTPKLPVRKMTLVGCSLIKCRLGREHLLNEAGITSNSRWAGMTPHKLTTVIRKLYWKPSWHMTRVLGHHLG